MPLYDVSAHARQSQASPSVSIEKGTYRMRAPTKRAPSRFGHGVQPSRDGIPPAMRYEKQMAILVMLLVCATVACFATAYYLFTTRWDTSVYSPMSILPSDNYSQPQVAVHPNQLLPPPTPAADVDLSEQSLMGTQERFLAYLPHSGFHNQRIALENALVLSRLLNRTLLVPPARLGMPLPHYSYRVLQDMLVNSSKPALKHCKRFVRQPETSPPECLDYFDYTDVSWDTIVNFSELEQKQKLSYRWDFSDEWLQDSLDLDEDDIYILEDTERDMYGFQDFISLTGTKTRKYQRMIHLSTLALHSERLLHVGSLFGTSRLHLRMADNLALRTDIRAQMAHIRPFFGDIATKITTKLGPSYIGAHIRLGDGFFEELADETVRTVWWTVVCDILGYDISEAATMERAFGFSNTTAPPERPLDVDTLSTSFFLETGSSSFSGFGVEDDHASRLPIPHAHCFGQPHTDPRLFRLNTPLFVATDAPDPRTDVRLALLLSSFPCTFFLSDPSFATSLAPLDRLRNPLDGLRLRPFLEPIVDAMVVAHGDRVVGTEGSTFSHFVQDVLWRVYRGLDVVSKG